MTWQPIETAPKGEPFDNGVLAWNGEFVAHVHNYHGWCYRYDGDDMPMTPQPTHWMPLPEAP